MNRPRFGLMYAALAALLLFLVASTAHAAEDAPILSAKRLSVALQAGAAWQDEASTGVLAVSPSYSLGSAVAVPFPVRYAFEGSEVSFEPRLSVVVLEGRPEVALQAGYAFADRSQGFVGASAVIPLRGRWALAFPALYFLDTEQTRLEAKLSFLAGGK